MKTVILCGGKGTRYGSDKPKTLVTIGKIPVIHHVIEIYSRQGYNDFILALGWKGNLIKKYFNNISHDYNIEFVDTGVDSDTGERIRQLKSYINDDKFFCTYSDGLANINLKELENEFSRNRWFLILATMTVVTPLNQFGVVEINNRGFVKEFYEKPPMSEWINGGFFIFHKDIFDYIKEGDSLEDDVLPRLVEYDFLTAYKHYEYWDTLNTPKDEIRLCKLAKEDNMKWYDL